MSLISSLLCGFLRGPHFLAQVLSPCTNSSLLQISHRTDSCLQASQSAPWFRSIYATSTMVWIPNPRCTGCYLEVRQIRRFGKKMRCHKEPEEPLAQRVCANSSCSSHSAKVGTKRGFPPKERSASVNTACSKLSPITRSKRKTRDPICHRRCFKH